MAPTSTRRPHFPAFPFPGFAGSWDNPPQPSNSGMSFRDYVAVKALQQLIPYGVDNDRTPRTLARVAYDIADAMIEQREK